MPRAMSSHSILPGMDSVQGVLKFPLLIFEQLLARRVGPSISVCIVRMG